MTTLLIVTDHRFYHYNDNYYDNYVFNYDFFKSYLEIYDEIKILVRVKSVEELDSNMQLSSGPNVSFIPLKDLRRFKLMFGIKREINGIENMIKNVDAVCFRLPSTISNAVYENVFSQTSIPYMFELIGDPEESLKSPSDNLLISRIKDRLSSSAKTKTRRIVNNAVCGSYVSFSHLQNKYPPNNDALVESISSIRLDSRYILNEINTFLDFKKLKIIHVGSFVEVKNQQFLVELTDLLIENGFDVSLTFIGDGNLIGSVKKLVSTKKLDKIVRFKGQITGFDKIVEELDHANIFMLPSLTEGMPRALIEAMSRGLLCLGSNRGGISELLPISHLFEPDSVQTAFSKLLFLLDNPNLIRESRIKNLKLANSFEMDQLQGKRTKLMKFLKTKVVE